MQFPVLVVEAATLDVMDELRLYDELIAIEDFSASLRTSLYEGEAKVSDVIDQIQKKMAEYIMAGSVKFSAASGQEDDMEYQIVDEKLNETNVMSSFQEV
eukprot:Awhi_evm1s3745